VHPLVIHSYVSRSYRDPENPEDVWIIIPVRYCGPAKALGRQYTERLFPDFLIPYARMRLDKVVEAVGEKASGSTLEECCLPGSEAATWAAVGAGCGPKKSSHDDK